MPRRRRRRKSSRNTTLELAQIVGLGLLLLMIILFRDEIAGGAGHFLDAFGNSEDIRVGADAGTPDAGRRDAVGLIGDGPTDR